MKQQLTVTIQPSGRTVMARIYEGRACAVTYSNRAQAEAQAAKLGPRWTVYRGMGRPFYVSLKTYMDRFADTVPEFQANVREMAARFGMTIEAAVASWYEYADRQYDQSAIVGEWERILTDQRRAPAGGAS